jgi:AmmeMemoRadiSam system protein A
MSGPASGDDAGTIRPALSVGPADYARRCVEAFVGSRPAPPPPADHLYDTVAACFCSLKKHGELRGCIGTLSPAEPSLGDEIARNAWAAAFRDPRFPPVAASELSALSYSVDVLSPSEPCEHADLDPRRYGVIVVAGARRGVLLPDLAGVDTVERQLAIALQKAGIEPTAPYAIERFSVRRFGEGAGCDVACG